MENDLKLERATTTELRVTQQTTNTQLDKRQLGKGKGRVLDVTVLAELYMERENQAKKTGKRRKKADIMVGPATRPPSPSLDDT